MRVSFPPVKVVSFVGPRICATTVRRVFRRFIGSRLLEAAYESPTMHVKLPPTPVHMHATRDPHQRTHCTQHT